jgi:hypothetical protein
MPRRSKTVSDFVDEIKEQPKRPRKKRELKVFPEGFKVGTLVQIETAEVKKRLGYVYDLCKYDGGLIIRLSDDGDITRYVCVQPELGDKIVRLNSSDGPKEKR